MENNIRPTCKSGKCMRRGVGINIMGENFALKQEKKLLEAKILEFYRILQQAGTIESREGLEAEYWANEYFKHFDLKIQTEGKI